jgi:hypothetical protein
MKRLSTLRVFALVVVAACGHRDQEARVVLSKPDAVLPGSFGQVSNVIELRDGRLALADLRERRFLFVNFSGRQDTIGVQSDSLRRGDPAPGKYKLPGHVLRFRGDTIGLVDYALERTSLWSEQGKFLTVLRIWPLGGTNPPLNYDTLGNVYKADYRSILGGLEPGRAYAVDSAPVLRYGLEDSTADTVARLRIPQVGQGKFGEEIKQVAVIFSPNDLFGVTPDGSIWVARATTNSLDWRAPSGTWTTGQPFPYEKIRVTKEDKDRFMDAAHRSGLPTALDIRYPFADFKPPFALAVGSPDHQVWLQRSRLVDDSIPVYDVMGGNGQRLRVVELPAGATVAGFGDKGAVYLAIRSGDGRQQVARFHLP